MIKLIMLAVVVSVITLGCEKQWDKESVGDKAAEVDALIERAERDVVVHTNTDVEAALEE